MLSIKSAIQQTNKKSLEIVTQKKFHREQNCFGDFTARKAITFHVRSWSARRRPQSSPDDPVSNFFDHTVGAVKLAPAHSKMKRYVQIVIVIFFSIDRIPEILVEISIKLAWKRSYKMFKLHITCQNLISFTSNLTVLVPSTRWQKKTSRNKQQNLSLMLPLQPFKIERAWCEFFLQIKTIVKI